MCLDIEGKHLCGKKFNVVDCGLGNVIVTAIVLIHCQKLGPFPAFPLAAIMLPKFAHHKGEGERSDKIHLCLLERTSHTAPVSTGVEKLTKCRRLGNTGFLLPPLLLLQQSPFAHRLASELSISMTGTLSIWSISGNEKSP